MPSGSDDTRSQNDLGAAIQRAHADDRNALWEYFVRFGNYYAVRGAPLLRPEHLEGCTMVPRRAHILDRLPDGGEVAEIGTLRGDLAAEILRRVEPDRLHLFDIDLSKLAPDRFAAEIESGRVVRREGDAVERLEELPDGYFDWIYIDADHSYDGVRRDIEVCKRKITHDGVLVFNDYAVWAMGLGRPYGVAKAVNELCLQEGWRFVYFALQSQMLCDVAIRSMNG